MPQTRFRYRRLFALLLMLALLAGLHLPTAQPQDPDEPEPTKLEADKPQTITFLGATEGYRTFIIDVPASVKKLHIVVYDATADIDIYAKHGSPIEDYVEGEYDHASETARLDEVLIISKESQPALKGGKYYVDVASLVETSSVRFTIVAAFDAAPTLPPLSLPPYRPMASLPPLQRAIDACVSVEGDGGGGSGTMLTPDGLLLTNAHVLELYEDEDGAPDDPDSDRVTGELQEHDIIIAFTSDVRKPPLQVYYADAIKIDRELDLALLKITRDLRDNPYDPQKNPLTWLPIGDTVKLTLDDPLRVLGFPSLGGMRARSSLTLTHGVVSGFTTSVVDDQLRWIKTDANISSGNSGGTCINQACQLVGVPTMVIYDEDGKIGFVRSMNRLPDSWQKLIKAGLASTTTDR